MQINYDDNDEKKKHPFYKELPIGFTVAVLTDFYDIHKRLIINKPYLIHSELDENKYWAVRTKPGFMQINDFMIFLEKGRVYVIK